MNVSLYTDVEKENWDGNKGETIHIGYEKEFLKIGIKIY